MVQFVSGLTAFDFNCTIQELKLEINKTVAIKGLFQLHHTGIKTPISTMSIKKD